MSTFADIPVRDAQAAIAAWNALDDLIECMALTDPRDHVRMAARATGLCFDNIVALARAVAGSPASQLLNAALMRLYNELG
ncbi:hypothetical protein [Pelagibacterium sediminicola]|uniref:hypothetical protein n=1 Tax=Pelagibacterium sediminicola TaxID=2248761 RepID=UPI000E30DEA1|nr:hypothetical protein [Pelagibacterium sediminicola]